MSAAGLLVMGACGDEQSDPPTTSQGGYVGAGGDTAGTGVGASGGDGGTTGGGSGGAAGSGPDCTGGTPEDYGAVGNGVADDTTAMQAAIDGESTLCMENTYLVSQLTIGADKTLMGGTILASSRVPGFIQISGDDIEITGTEFNGQNNAYVGIRINSGSDRVTFDDVIMHNIYAQDGEQNGLGFSISGSGVSDITIENSHIHNIGGHENGVIGDSQGANRGIYMGTPSSNFASNVIIRNNRFDDIAGHEDGDAIQIAAIDYASYDNVEIADNIFNDCGKRGIKVQAGGATITGNEVYATWTDANDTMAYGIEVWGTGNVVSNNIVDVERLIIAIAISGGTDHAVEGNTVIVSRVNHFTTARGSQVYGMRNASTGSVIRGNTITSWQNGIYDHSAGNNTYDQNWLNNSFLYVNNAGSGTDITNNTVVGQDDGSYSKPYYGMYFMATATGMTVTGNDISYARDGMIFNEPSYSSSTVSGNVFSNIQQNDIRIDN